MCFDHQNVNQYADGECLLNIKSISYVYVIKRCMWMSTIRYNGIYCAIELIRSINVLLKGNEKGTVTCHARESVNTNELF